MKNFYNNKTFIEEFEKRTEYSMSYVTLLKYVGKGLIKQSGIVKNGKQRRPLYSESSLENFVFMLPELLKHKLIRLKKRDAY